MVSPKNKKDEDGNIIYNQYEDLVIHKVDNKNKGIANIKFCIEDANNRNKCDETYHKSIKNEKGQIIGYENDWITDKNGIIKIPYNDLLLYSHTLIEKEMELKTNNKEKDEYKWQEKSTKTLRETKGVKIYVDQGNRFLGEVKGGDFITYANLLKQIDEANGVTNKSLSYYENKNNPTTNELGNSTIVGNILPLGNDSKTGGNWLKIYDAREGKTLYIAKKPLTNNVSWDMLYKAGVVYGSEFINTKKDGPNIGKLKSKKELDKIGQGIYAHFKTLSDTIMGNTMNVKYGEYTAKIIEINGKRYIVRLLKGYSIKNNNGDPNQWVTWNYDVSKGSEWNRYLLPLIRNYRYGINFYTEFLESELQDGGKGGELDATQQFDIQLAIYNWFGDLTLGQSRDVRGKGQSSWMQGIIYSSRALRGSSSINGGAANTTSKTPSTFNNDYGFRPVLEEIL